MTMYLKNNPVAIDAEIQRYQKILNNEFGSSADIYGKLYINEKDKVKVAEAYIGNGEYTEIFVDDTKAPIVIGFLPSDIRKGLNMVKTSIDLIVSCNLERLYNTTERKDEDILNRVTKIIRMNTLYKMEQEIKTGLKNVFSNFSPERFKYRDIQPYFNFSVVFEVIYKS